MALGADARRIFGLVLSEGAVIIATGKGVGVLGATLLRHTIETQLYQTNPMELGVLIAVGGVLVVVALLATAIPARRAAKTEPNIALTHL
jgi:ABC-type lipoprotein release transport system permease subunit